MEASDGSGELTFYRKLSGGSFAYKAKEEEPPKQESKS